MGAAQCATPRPILFSMVDPPRPCVPYQNPQVRPGPRGIPDFDRQLGRTPPESPVNTVDTRDYRVEDVPLHVLAGHAGPRGVLRFDVMRPHDALLPDRECCVCCVFCVCVCVCVGRGVVCIRDGWPSLPRSFVGIIRTERMELFALFECFNDQVGDAE